MTFICYPKCTTCQKAQKWLDENGISYTFRDIKMEHPTYEELSRRRKKPLPENNGKPWTEELDDELCRLFDGGMKKKDLCTHFGRTSGAIESRLERLGKL